MRKNCNLSFPLAFFHHTRRANGTRTRHGSRRDGDTSTNCDRRRSPRRWRGIAKGGRGRSPRARPAPTTGTPSRLLWGDPIVAQWNHKHAVRRSLSSQSVHWPMQPPGQLSAVRGGRTSRRCIQFPNRQPQRLSTARVVCACGRRGERTCS